MGSPAAAASSGSGSGTSISGERLTFSSVARLGFAAAHDSPALKTEEIPFDQPHDSAAIGNLYNYCAPFGEVSDILINLVIL